ncbi:tRNA lysidine(34) synthetase TilS [Pseudonocardia sp. KRD291]|uniref:tRNA lysidine(34) synthetase TilS n=1 Tax=Pseudonocardia sp. KRD291 TaxID=2792007 RepID=UPI001CF7E0B2|nr:tRNA lysidine(34) synthetase TilS [Pseudonocardia sp. KRD291]
MSPSSGPATRQVRAAVRSALGRLPPGARDAPPVVACSGGPDSTALLDAVVALVADPPGVHAVVVDHGLQDGSAERSSALAAELVACGVSARVRTVRVDGDGGPEAAARHARYDALAAARPHPDSPVLLGHTLDDQAETVLLGLGRGSGARSLAGMREWNAPWLRPLLAVPRAVTVAACAEAGRRIWSDPHNADPRFTRVRLRHEVLPLLDEVLAGGVASALARTAAQLREDDDALVVWADRVRAAASDGAHSAASDGVRAVAQSASAQPARRDPADTPAAAASAPDPSAGPPGDDGPSLRVTPLADVPAAVRRRVLREWLRENGVRALTEEHLRAADDLVGRWRGQGGPALGGGLDLVRARGRLVLRRHVRGGAGH